MKQAIDAFHDVGLYEAGYRHFHLDDCWAGTKDPKNGSTISGRNVTGYLEADRCGNMLSTFISFDSCWGGSTNHKSSGRLPVLAM
eukprot:SAG31_NODE_1818_length_7201_cov_11.041819_1_plen_85_part_00